ncbi:MAG TPA: glycoside hydrolase family 3 N-terminal domain-containing protein [Ignavibacteria bacterium]|nr:glycoside hydrolase family 3 N-terminal domain-containing protein [Ignavibacteria bacterium]
MKFFLILFCISIFAFFGFVQNDKTYNQRILSQINTSDDQIEKIISEMTLREKVAQMMVTNSFGFDLDENSDDFKRFKNLIEVEKVGGVIFFKGNSVQEANLINKLQSYSNIPLLISADFERGTAMRLEDGSLFPSNMGLGATRNTELAYKMGLQIAKECRAIGVHQNYSPVVDVNNNPKNPIINVRSFGEDPLLVSQMGDAMIKGLQDGNVIATAKHFPGHGDTDIDSHSDLPIINFGMDRLNSIELVPFKSAINSGVKSVMIAHLSFPAVDVTPFLPSSLSKKIVTDILINDLNFNGLIVTDALNMKGITKHFTTKEVALSCVDAGIDIILMPQGEKESIDAIVEAVGQGVFSEERINKSVRKILEAKKWAGLFENKFVDVNNVKNIVNSNDAKILSQQIADASITLVKNNNSILPFTNVSDNSAFIISLNNGNETANADYFIKTFSESNMFKSLESVNLTGDLTNVDELISKSKNFDNIIIPIYAKVKIMTGTVGLPETQLNLINALVQNGKKVTVLSMGNPYLIQGFDGIDAYVCAFGDSEATINSTIKAINGTIKFKGKLPVGISEEFPYGTGILN